MTNKPNALTGPDGEDIPVRAEYTLQILGTVSAPQLHQKITSTDAYQVVERAKEMAKAFNGVRWFMGIRVWRGEDTLIATVTLVEEPTVNVVMGGGK